MEEFNIEQIENYLSDLDNLVDTGHFSEIDECQPFNSTNGTNKALWSDQSTECLT